jgi:hypothetical protein
MAPVAVKRCTLQASAFLSSRGDSSNIVTSMNNPFVAGIITVKKRRDAVYATPFKSIRRPVTIVFFLIPL